MKLSEAIRLGALLRPQRIVGKPEFNHIGSCALMAALEAVGKPQRSAVCWTEAGQEWPWLWGKFTNPVTGIEEEADGIILVLNDQEEWTREQIADWVATVEPNGLTWVEAEVLEHEAITA